MVASPKGLGPEKHCAGKGQQQIQKRDPSSRQKGSPTKKRPQLSSSNRYLVMNPTWETYWLTDRQSQCDFTFGRRKRRSDPVPGGYKYGKVGAVSDLRHENTVKIPAGLGPENDCIGEGRQNLLGCWWGPPPVQITGRRWFRLRLKLELVQILGIEGPNRRNIPYSSAIRW
jgi:hypothetical protein